MVQREEAPKFKVVGTSPIFKKRSDRRVRLLSNLFVFSLLNFIAAPLPLPLTCPAHHLTSLRPVPAAPLIIRLPVKLRNRTEGEKSALLSSGELRRVCTCEPLLYLGSKTFAAGFDVARLQIHILWPPQRAHLGLRCTLDWKVFVFTVQSFGTTW